MEPLPRDDLLNHPEQRPDTGSPNNPVTIDAPATSTSTKRKRPASTLTPDDYIDIIASLLPPGELQNRVTTAIDARADLLRSLTSVPIGSMKEEQICRDFGLSTIKNCNFEDLGRYEIELPDIDPASQVKWPGVSPSLQRFVHFYMHAVRRNSKALCRTIVDVILIECLCILDGYATQFEQLNKSGDFNISQKCHARTTTPNKFSRVKIFGEVSCTYEGHGNLYNGQLDYGIGIPLDAQPPLPAGANRHAYAALRKPSLLSLLNIMEAKTEGGIEGARVQLLGYLGCIYAWRRGRRKPTSRVFGIATDGFVWQFVRISDGGEVQETDKVDITRKGGGLEKVIRAVIAVLAEAIDSATPFTSSDGKVAEGQGEMQDGGAANIEPDAVLDPTGSGFFDIPTSSED